MAKEKIEAPVFDKDDLIKDAFNLFGVNPEVMAGALYNVTEPLTKDQAKNGLEEFLNRPVNR